MPIEAIYWDWNKRAAEIHVLPGTTSPNLVINYLRVQRRNATQDPEFPFMSQHMADHPGDISSVSFTIADASVAPGASVRSFGPAITLNGTTGQVTVVAAGSLPARFPQNFLIEVRVVSGTQPAFKELIRVHVHRSVTSIWLTPGTMKVQPFPVPPPAPDKMVERPRFALRARFDDQTVGDITDWPIVAWSSKRGAATTAHTGAAGRLTVVAADVPLADVTVTARLTGLPAVAAATATLRPVAKWGPAAPIDARIVPRAGWPSTFPFALDAVPNVLFVPDGFPVGTETTFFNYVADLVGYLTADSINKPWDVLARATNFWAAFIASDQAGVTWASEVFVSSPGGSTVASPVPKPERPQDLEAGKKWGLENLIYEVGLPTPNDRPANAARTGAQIMADWDALFTAAYRAHLPTPDALRDMLIDSWRELGTRRIVDDLDTPLGIMSGAPRVDPRFELIDLNPDRMDRSRMDALMSAIKHDDFATSGLDLSTIWTNDRKRNYDLVCIVTSGPGRALNGDGYFMSAQFGWDPVPCTLSGINDITLNRPLIRGIATPDEKGTFVHELSHSFDLGDEYGGTNDRPLFDVDVENANRTQGNLLSPASLQRAGAIHGDELKWRWPRIKWAAEIIGPITSPAADVFEAQVRWSHAFAFPIGQIVHLRFRNIDIAFRDIDHDGVHFPDQRASLIKLPLVSVPLRLVDTFETGTPPRKNVRLRVEAGAVFPYPAAQTVLSAGIIAAFPAGSIVYQPTPAPAGALDTATYPYAELVAKNVKDLITTIHGPLGQEDARHFPTVPDFHDMPLPPGLSASSLPFIVGLHEGGMGNNRGVFRPTGACAMSHHTVAVEDDSGVRVVGVRFCHVCKYILVDAIDPSRHLFIDPEYDEIYPQR
jgi:hypothetical protein